MSSSVDVKVAAAAREAARTLVTGPSFREDLLHDALEPALERQFGAGRVHRRLPRRATVLPGWEPQPSSIDVCVTNKNGETWLAFELKVDDLRFTLWDMLKMAAAARLGSVERAYLVVAARIWDSSRARQPGRRFFPASSGDPQRVAIEALFEEYGNALAHDYAVVGGRLTEFPEALELSPIAAAEVPAWPKYEIRAIGVRPVGAVWPAVAGWPADLLPPGP